ACPPEVLPSAPCPGWSHHTLKPLGAGTRGTGYIMPVTNAIESLHMQLRKIIKARGHFPSDEAALKLIWLALRNVVAKWTGSRHDWKSAMTQFALLYPERFNIGI
ncbi:transposase, partial [Burkholderia multivorans]|uniref:transposase n=1 Tax=Burkholderia multivorans TaxID=87883 RepID=UPI0020B4095F